MKEKAGGGLVNQIVNKKSKPALFGSRAENQHKSIAKPGVFLRAFLL
jgi:hypothetical protein